MTEAGTPNSDDGMIVKSILEGASELDRRGLLSASGHGNVSSRVRGVDAMWYTAHPSLRTVRREHVARIGFDGRVLSGTVSELSYGGARMHLGVYMQRPDVGAVVHTHSPAATSYAVAGQPIDCWSEPLDIFGIHSGVPVVPYAVRGSDEAVRLIRERCQEETVRAILLANHGLLAWGADTVDAVHVATLVEEAAQLGLGAMLLGGPVPIPRLG